MDSVSMRRRVLGGAAAAVLLLTAGILLRPEETVQQDVPQIQAEASLTDEPLEMPEPTAPSVPYRLGIWQGRVAVFEGEETQPLTVLETPVSALPQPDQQSLENGIAVYSREELAGLLEDYGS